LALLSHLMTAFFVHVPMAYASMMPMPAAAAEPAASQPCPDHLNMSHGSDAAQASDQGPASGASSTATDHESGCKGGFCKCPCAHAQALTVMPMLTPTLVGHSPAISPYRVPLAPDCETSFFRPPI
jgi:hypothetical protein